MHPPLDWKPIFRESHPSFPNRNPHQLILSSTHFQAAIALETGRNLLGAKTSKKLPFTETNTSQRTHCPPKKKQQNIKNNFWDGKLKKKTWYLVGELAQKKKNTTCEVKISFFSIFEVGEAEVQNCESLSGPRCKDHFYVVSRGLP